MYKRVKPFKLLTETRKLQSGSFSTVFQKKKEKKKQFLRVWDVDHFVTKVSTGLFAGMFQHDIAASPGETQTQANPGEEPIGMGCYEGG
jgi:hypothetical protein